MTEPMFYQFIKCQQNILAYQTIMAGIISTLRKMASSRPLTIYGMSMQRRRNER